MKKLSNFTALVVGFLFLLLSCQKGEEEMRPQPAPDYPTVYKPLSNSEWEVRNSDFQQVNIHEGLSLNEYGFVEGEISFSENDSVTADYVFENVGHLISKYRNFMGIDNLENINLEEHLKIYDPLLIPFPEVIVEYYFAQMEDLKEDDFWDEVSEEYQRHVFFIFQTSIMDKPFDGPALYFGFDEVNNVLKINGNWFSNTLVPKNEVYTKTDVTVMAYQAIKEREGIDLWESKHLFRANKLFITRKVGKKTEIRECWRVVADIGDYEKYYIFVDTQTGEVVSQYIRSRLYYI